MSGMDEPLRPQKSRITIYDEPVICRFCSRDVFIPYEVFVNVEQPGVNRRHVSYIAICQLLGGKYVPENTADYRTTYYNFFRNRFC